MEFPSLVWWHQPKGLQWFGSCDHSVVLVSDSGAILNSADHRWSRGRNRNQMWAVAAKRRLSEQRRASPGSSPLLTPPTRSPFQTSAQVQKPCLAVQIAAVMCYALALMLWSVQFRGCRKPENRHYVRSGLFALVVKNTEFKRLANSHSGLGRSSLFERSWTSKPSTEAHLWLKSKQIKTGGITKRSHVKRLVGVPFSQAFFFCCRFYSFPFLRGKASGIA